MRNTQAVDVYKIQLLASSFVNNRVTADEFQRACHLLTETERRALYERVDEIKGRSRQPE
jgi:hypothetical protein